MVGTRDRVVIGEITLPGVRRSVRCARGFVRNAAAGHPALDDMVLVVSETVANAIAHTASGLEGGLVRVAVLAGDGGYRLEVADEGAAGGRPRVKGGHADDEQAGEGAESGRGMRIVEALASRWGFHADGVRTVVWAEFPPREALPAPGVPQAPAAAVERGRGRGAPVSGPG
ncbi:ATP-binding protein [Actinomadura sp. NPDC049753]|uniref:ATP-binding protein n=1 Tax=Actinomadura sp. NPDC049753 TaxID=3154739 RepID=UPI00341A93D4